MGTIAAAIATIAVITTTTLGAAVGDSKPPPPQADPQVRLIHLRAAERLLSDRKLVRKWEAAQERARKREERRERLQRTIPASNDWQTSVALVQRAFPGTSSWLLSCSAAEGGHGRWVTYGGGSYYPGFEHRYIVGGPLQFKWPTFKGMYRRGLESLRSRGFIVSLPPPDDVSAWLSMTAQAIAGGWARWSGNDDSHWSASWGRGC